MTNASTHQSIAVLKLPRPFAILISVAKAIVIAMTGNPAFPSPLPTLAVISAAIADLEAASAPAQSRAPGGVVARNRKRAALAKLLEQLRGYVQTVADADPERASELIQSAAMTVKKVTRRAKRVFAALQGTVTGAITLVTASAGSRASYEWQMSADGGKTWQPLPVTIRACASVTGLQAGATYMFRSRTVTIAGESDWSQPVTRIVL